MALGALSQAAQRDKHLVGTADEPRQFGGALLLVGRGSRKGVGDMELGCGAAATERACRPSDVLGE